MFAPMGDHHNLSISTTVITSQEATRCSPTSFGDAWHYSAQALTVLGIVMAAAGTTVSAAALAVVTSTRLPNRALRLGLFSLTAADLLFALTTIAQLSFVYYWAFDGSGGHKCGSGSDDNGGDDASSAAAAALDAERGEQKHRREWCANKVLERMWDVATNANQMTLVFLAAQQFAVIRWPLHFRDGLPAGRCGIALALAWVASAAAGLAPVAIVALSTKDHPAVEPWPAKGTTRFCYQLLLYDLKSDDLCGPALQFGQDGHQQAIVAFGAALTGVVLLILGVSYGYLIVVVVRHALNDSYRSDCSDMDAHISLTKQPPTEHSVQFCPPKSQKEQTQQQHQQHEHEHQQQHHHRHHYKQQQLHESERTSAPLRHHSARRAVTVTAAVTAVCTVCYLPLHVVHFLNGFFKDECSGCRNPAIYPALLAMACSAPLADPLIYTLRLKPLRDSALRRLARLFCRPWDANRSQRPVVTAVIDTSISRNRPATDTHLPAAVDQ